MTLVATGLAAWLAAATTYQIAAQAALRRLLSRRPDAAKGPLPEAAILRPLDDDAPVREDELAALCAQGVPVVVGVESERSRAGEAAIRVSERAGSGSLTVVVGTGPEGTNRKVAKLICMLPRAQQEIIVLTDGDVATPAGYLEAVLAPFVDSDVGMVTCPYRSVGGGSLASRLDVILTNTGFLPSVALAARLEGVRFGLGATIAVRRSVLEGNGGLASLRDVLADDWAIADRALLAGHRIVLVPLLLDHHVSDALWRTVWRRHVRWARTIRVLRPAGYAGTIVAYGWAPALGLASLGGGTRAAAILAGYALARIAGVAANARRTGLGTKDLMLLPLADVVSMLVYAAGLIGRRVHWGKRRLVLRSDGSIETFS